MTREQIIHDLETIKEYFCAQNGGSAPLCLEEAIKIIEDRPTGEWYYSCQNGWHCSICHESVKDMPTANFAFCPNCGADMKGEEE